MLVLTRQPQDDRNRIVIGPNIVITILDVQDDIVRVGIDAPRNLDIVRAEIMPGGPKFNPDAAAARDSRRQENFS